MLSRTANRIARTDTVGSLLAAPRPHRSFASSSTSFPTRRQHLLWCGNLLGYTSDRLTKLPRAWIDSLGVASDVDQGLQWTHISASPTHTLLAYRLLPPLAPPPTASAGHDAEDDQHATEDDSAIIYDGPRETSDSAPPSSLPHKVLAMGKNTHAQLGLGFASQEATRGMVTGTFDGKGGVRAVCSGGCASFIVTQSGSSEEGSSLYAFGNHTLGQLGLGPASSPSHSADPYDVTPRQESGDAQLVLHPLPRQVDLDASLETGHAAAQDGWRVEHMAAGMDHTLLIRSREAEPGHLEQQVMSTGFNTDGQLGLSTGLDVPISPLITRTFHVVPLPALEAASGDRFVSVAAGADTSFALSQSGRLFAWGNSEYGQAMLDSGVEDRVPTPVEVTGALKRACEEAGLELDGARIKKVVAGGSWAGVLDDRGRVWTAGYGPLGLGAAEVDESLDLPPPPKASVHLSRVSALPPGITDIQAGLDYAVAIGPTDKQASAQSSAQDTQEPQLPRIFTWGLDTVSGRLGLGLGTTSSPSDRLRSDPSRKSDRPSGIGMSTGMDRRRGNGGGAGDEAAPRVYTPVEVPRIRLGRSPEDEWLDANPAERKKRNDREAKKRSGDRDGAAGKVSAAAAAVEDAKVLEVACGSEAMFVLIEDGLNEVGRWNECYGPPDAGTDVAMQS
ncbi:uncharacterized protein PFL1_01231 [Pseudozyma flocculosa PF-1]|uniref:Uncharacterized protein n=1 Tax=Pseudozyma flocculosa TaxID=84751 RepID=A0A5C3EWC0_9BASI|nr:uncharacterized protein PFL1_01231 [Pseudozyma flocculosa PF-1]EPQ31042.1 hypothetical protein PFL1_01231 [Pseudozyma flocculosa PF-1]SPO35886.1 uncharacterized protein PSFLO_01357 [Pseudozyma flocculosa]